MPRSAATVLRVHERDAGREDRLEQPDQHGIQQHVGPAVGQFAVVADAHRLRTVVVHLRDEGAEPLGQREKRLQAA